MWSVESSVEVEATPAEVWRLYADPSTWRQWAHSTAGATADGPLVVGVPITVTPTRGPVQRVRVVALDAERTLSTELNLPGARMSFHYRIEPSTTGCRVHHSVRMDGPLAAAYGVFMRRSNERKLAAETARLADLVRRPA
jgi:uncharacterized protein YndB with AHSA1/START domain